MKINKENIFISIIAIIVVAGSLKERMLDKRYTTSDKGSIPTNNIILDEKMEWQNLTGGSTIATGGSMIYLFLNDSISIQYNFRTKIKSVSYEDTHIAVQTNDSVYRIDYKKRDTLLSKFETEIPPIPIASIKFFAQSIATSK